MPSYQRHTARLIVNRQAVCDNWSIIDTHSAPSCQTGAVIKADAYGLGMVPVALALYQRGCRDFYTARLSEAILLSEAFAVARCSECRIIVFDGILAGQEDAFLSYRLIPVLNDRRQYERAKAMAQNTERTIAVMIHIDTAMSRLGFAPEDWQALSSEPDWDKGLDIQMLLSHLASADDRQAEQNRIQLADFEALTKAFEIPRSLANSGGTLLDTAYHFEATRPGLALYGMSPQEDSIGLQTALRLETDILQIREVAQGTTVGYGASFVAPHAMRLATLGIGYADGLLRHYKDHITSFIGDTPCPLVGRISMDSCVIDISGLSEAEISRATQAVIFDDRFTPKDLAHKTGTIAYEIITTLGERVLRQYD